MKDILIPLITLLVGLVIAFPAGIAYRRKVAEAELGSAEEEAKRVLSDAIKNRREQEEGSSGGGQGRDLQAAQRCGPGDQGPPQ